MPFNRKRGFLVSLCLAGALFGQADLPFRGRWDLTVNWDNMEYPIWLEVTGGAEPKVRMVGRVGSAHPVDPFVIREGHLRFASGEWFGYADKLAYDCRADGPRITCAITSEKSGKVAQAAGAPAPALRRAAPAKWDAPAALFNGRNLEGWRTLRSVQPRSNNWKGENGVLVNTASGFNIATTREFQDFKLHFEVNCPAKCNSGVYLRGRYEIQIEGEPTPPGGLHKIGAVYGFLAPAAEMPRKAGEWQSFDITLIGRFVTVVQNGRTIIASQEIPGPTGGALNGREEAPGPIYLQGDHGAVSYRNMVLTPAAN